MKFHAVLFASPIVLLSVFPACFAQQNPGAVEDAIDRSEIQKPAESEAATARQEIQKPSESEAIEAAKRYLNRHGHVTFQDAEFLAWGAFNEKLIYWPVKVRLGYTAKGSDTLQHSVYALAISKDSNGKWKAGPYHAWKTGFK